MEEKLKAIFKKYKIIACCSHEELTKEVFDLFEKNTDLFHKEINEKYNNEN